MGTIRRECSTEPNHILKPVLDQFRPSSRRGSSSLCRGGVEVVAQVRATMVVPVVVDSNKTVTDSYNQSTNELKIFLNSIKL